MARLVPFRYRLLVLCTILGFTVVAGSAMSFVDTRPVKVRAEAWAEAAKAAGTLPTTLEELERYPLAFRKSAVRRLSPELHSSIMQAHLRAFLNSEDLNAEQSALVRRLIARATPSLIAAAGNPDHPEMVSLKNECQEIGRLFSKEHRKVFSSIGQRTVPEEARYVAWVRKAKLFLGDPVVLADAEMHNCDCAEDTSCPDCNYPEEGCTFGEVPACSKYTECGCLGLSQCAGMCRQIA